ncbi:MAG TPA: FHA domain-containing protein, partial [Gemmatimonadales bacterium]|nr:FHA domain-containing protein [Gemmatimonadales bacterium]
LTQVRAAHACSRCGRLNEKGTKFCPACGASTGDTGPQAKVPAPPRASKITPHLALLDRTGNVAHRFPVENAVTTVGRQGADINFPDDEYLSPLHAQFLFVDGILTVRDLGSKNGTWLYLDEAHRLTDGDAILLGSQIIRFRRLGYPGPRPPEQDQTRRLGSLAPAADIANLAQIRADGSARDILHLSPGRSTRIGREQGDWQFPYDSSMSALHALIRSEDADFVLLDAGSRNGVAVAVRGERRVSPNARLLVGDQMLRAEIG